VVPRRIVVLYLAECSPARQILPTGSFPSLIGDCPPGSFAYADPTEESFEGHGHVKGTRTVTISPSFFTDPRTTRDLPGPDDKEGLKKYCKNKESKKIKDFEVGGM
jgi:hypothetical protein